jgi:hypothetical protein
MVIELPKNSLGTSFSEGLAAVWVGDRDQKGWGFINQVGDFVIEPNRTWDWAFPFNEGFAAVQSVSDKHWGFIDKGGYPVVPCQYELPEGYPLKVSETMAAVQLNGKWGYLQLTTL